MIVRDPVGPVQVLPPGLLNLLQLKSAGFSPDALRQDIQPTVDLEAFWLRATRRNLPAGPYQTQYTAGTINGAAGIFNAGLQAPRAPNNAWWYVHNCTVLAAATTASTSTLAMIKYQAGGGSAFAAIDSMFRLSEYLQTLAVGTNYIFGAEGFWLPPGASLAMFVGTVGALGTLDLYLLGFEYSELPL